MNFEVNDSDAIISVLYVDAAIALKALEALLEENYSISGYDFTSGGYQITNDGALGWLYLTFEMFAMNGTGYHVGTETCTARLPLIPRSQINVYTNDLKAKTNELARFVVRLDCASIELDIEPAIDPDTQCESCDAYDPDADFIEECESCDSLYYPGDEDFWWQTWVEPTIRELKKMLESGRFQWRLSPDREWVIIDTG